MNRGDAVPDGDGNEPAHATGDEVAWTDSLSEQARDWYFIALDLQNDGRLAIGADLLVRASCLDGGSAPLREAAARAQFRASQYFGSSVTFTAMFALNTKDDFAWYASGLCLALMGYFDKALLHLTEAAGRRPDVERYGHALAVVQKVSDEVEGDPVLMPSYLVPRIPIASELLALELGARPGPAESSG